MELGFLTFDKLHDSNDILGKSPSEIFEDIFSRMSIFNESACEGRENILKHVPSEENGAIFDKNEFRDIIFSFLRVFIYFLMAIFKYKNSLKVH